MSTARHVRIVIADDHQIFRDGLRRLLDSEPGFEVVAEAADGEEAVRVTGEVRPDILLLDVSMPRLGGVEALAAPELANTRVVLLTAAIERLDLLRAIQQGARGVVLKESATRVLIDGIHKVLDGRLLLSAGLSDDLGRGGEGRALIKI